MDNLHEFTPAQQIEEEASDWLARMDADQKLTQQELAELKQWMNRSPVHRAEFNRLMAFWQQANVLTELSIPLRQKTSTGGVWWLQPIGWPRLGALAAVLLVAVLISINFNLLSPNQLRVAGNGVYETRIGEQNSITLVDGSVIELNTNSRVQVNYTDQRRAIKLMQGEAFFDVSKDTRRPFEVAAGNGVVRAVGTAFAVRFNQQALTVTVTEGKVALAAVAEESIKTPSTASASPPAAARANMGSLVAGQRAEFKPLLAQALDATTKTLESKAINNALAWREGLLMFNGEPLNIVVKEMNRYTALTIEIADPSIANLQIGGQFKVGETEAMLKNLAVSFDLDIQKVNENLIHLVKKNNKK